MTGLLPEGSDGFGCASSHTRTLSIGRYEKSSASRGQWHRCTDARICSYVHAKHTPKLLGGLTDVHTAKGQVCVYAHPRTQPRTQPRTHTPLVGGSVGASSASACIANIRVVFVFFFF